MKKIEDFSGEEVGEEWLRELYKVVAMRRRTMFRLITESTRLLLFGNAGGTALIVGFMSAATSGNEEGLFHWVALINLLVFAVGTLASALTMILVALVSIKEAHGAETGLKRFVDGEIDRTEVLFIIEQKTFRLADLATGSGLVSAVGFMLGGFISLILLTIFF